MNPAEGLFQAICADPEDDNARLIYADWLDEAGDPRGAFIRAQFLLETLPEEHSQRPELEAYVAAALKEHKEDWAGPIAGWARHLVFRKGFVDEVVLPAKRFLRQANELFRLAPVQALRLENVEPYMQALDSNLLRSVRRLNLSSNLIGEVGIRRLLTGNRLFNLRELNLDSTGLGTGGILALASTGCLANLTHLSVCSNHLDAQALEPLRRSRCLDGLISLNLRSNDVKVEGVRVLSRASCLGNLNHLDLSWCSLNDQAIPVLAQDAYRMRLKSLCLAAGRMGVAGIEALKTAPNFRHLEKLDLKWSRLSHLCADGLARMDLPRLRSLTLSDNALRDDGLQALIQLPTTSQWQELSLSCAGLTARAMQSLGTTLFNELKRIDLSDNKLEDAGILLLAKSRSFPRLHSLDLSSTHFNESGAVALASSPLLTSVLHLDLRRNDLGLAGAKALTESRYLEQVRRLDLRYCEVGAEGVVLLRKRFGSRVQLEGAH